MILEKRKEKKVNYEYEARRYFLCFKEIRQVKYVCGVGA
jgi:hypothetical protein